MYYQGQYSSSTGQQYGSATGQQYGSAAAQTQPQAQYGQPEAVYANQQATASYPQYATASTYPQASTQGYTASHTAAHHTPQYGAHAVAQPAHNPHQQQAAPAYSAQTYAAHKPQPAAAPAVSAYAAQYAGYKQAVATPTPAPAASTGLFPIPGSTPAAQPARAEYIQAYTAPQPAAASATPAAQQVQFAEMHRQQELQRQQLELQRQQQQLEIQKNIAAAKYQQIQQQVQATNALQAQQLALAQRQRAVAGGLLSLPTLGGTTTHPSHLRPRSDKPMDRDRDRDRDSRRLRPLLRERRLRDRRASPPRREVSLVPAIDLSAYTHNYRTLKLRYPNLYVPTDFCSLECSWTRTIRVRGATPRPLFVTNDAVDFEVTNNKGDAAEELALAEASVSASGKRYNVRVALLNAIPAEDLVNNYVPHLARQLKFLVQEKEEGDTKYLSMIGGSWSAEDGGDPDNDLQSLIRTAIRTTKDFCGVNLEQILKWSVLGKIHYIRPQEERHGKMIPRRDDVTVVLVPHLSHWDPSAFTTVEETPAEPEAAPVEETPENTTDMEGVEGAEGAEGGENEESKPESEKPAEEKKPAIPGMVQKTADGIMVSVVTTVKKIKARLLSLDGLLDYRPSDKMEKTFEVSVCAEMCKEMLQRDFGTTIYEALFSAPDNRKEREERREKEREAAKENEKRERDKEEELTSTKTKKQKTDAEVKEEPTGTEAAADKATTKDQEGERKESTREKESFRQLVNPALFAAYRFFDRSDKGWLAHHEVEDIVHSLNRDVTQKQVRTVLDIASTSSSSSKVYYKDQTHIEAKDGESKHAPEFVFSSDFVDFDEELPAATGATAAAAAASNENFIQMDNLMNRLERSEAARRQALAQVSHTSEENHRLKESIESSEKKYAELSVAAHASDAFYADKIKESANIKQILTIIKSALKRAEDTGALDADMKEEVKGAQ